MDSAATPTVVPFRLQRLESWVGLTAALAAVWPGVVLGLADVTLWGLAAYAAAIAGWAHTYPAQKPGWMLLRGLALLVGGVLLAALPILQGPAGPAMGLLLAATCGYALLLPWRWALGLHLAALLGWVGAAVLARPAWAPALAGAGLLALLPAMCVGLARSLQASERMAERGRRDARSQLYNEEGFFANGSELFRSCRRRGQPFTLVVLRAPELRDAADLLGRKGARALFAQVVAAIHKATPPGGIAARTDAVEFAVAMPDVALDKARETLHQRLGQPMQVQVRLGAHDAAIVLDAEVAQAPPELHTLEELYDRLRLRLRRPGDSPPSAPASMPHTLQGFLMDEPRLPFSDKPTLPMPLDGAGKRAPARRA